MGQVAFERVQLSDQFYAEGGAIGDFDGDGHQDVAVGPWIYWGPDLESKSRFCEGEALEPQGYSANFLMDSGDVNGDGHLDIFVIGFPGEPSWWFENPGVKRPQELWPRHVMLDQVDNESPWMADIDGDGSLDLICSSGGHYGFASHAGQDPRQRWKFYKVSPNNNYHRYTHGLGVGDVNNDGHLDLIEKDGWWQNPGSHTEELWEFQAYQFSAAGGAQMFAIDLDGDGINEVVTSLEGHGFGLAYFKSTNQSANQFQRFDIMTGESETSPVGIAVSQLHAVALADINCDGVPDIVTGKRWWAHANKDPGNEQPATLLWIETQRIGQRLSFVAHVIDNSSGVGTDISVGDINGDGLPDILSGTKRGAHVFLQRPKQLPDDQFLLPGIANLDRFGQRIARDSIEIEGGSVPTLNGRPLNWDFTEPQMLDWEIRGGIRQAERQPGWMDTGSKNPEWIGEIISRPFVMSHPKLSFVIAGGNQPDLFVEVISEQSGRRLAVVPPQDVPPRDLGPEAETASNPGDVEPSKATLDLSAWIGELVRIRIVDHSPTSFIRCGRFRMQP